jgi:hypothetical protein
MPLTAYFALAISGLGISAGLLAIVIHKRREAVQDTPNKRPYPDWHAFTDEELAVDYCGIVQVNPAEFDAREYVAIDSGGEGPPILIKKLGSPAPVSLTSSHAAGVDRE